MLFDQHTGRLDLRIRGRGHWGDREYDGCADVRRGAAGYLMPVGGNGTTTMALIT